MSVVYPRFSTKFADSYPHAQRQLLGRISMLTLTPSTERACVAVARCRDRVDHYMRRAAEFPGLSPAPWSTAR